METTMQAKTLMDSIENLGSTLNRFEGLSQFSRLMVDRFERVETSPPPTKAEKDSQKIPSTINLIDMYTQRLNVLCDEIEKNIDTMVTLIG